MDEVVSIVIIGAVAQFLLWLALWIVGKDTKIMKGRRWVFLVVGFLVFAMAAHVVISAGQYFSTQLDAIRKSVASPPIGPSAIRGSVRRCEISTPSALQDSFLIVFNLRLVNPGIPSNVWKWNLSVTLPAKQQYEYKPVEMHNTTDRITSDMYDIKQENYLPFQLLEKSVGPDRGAVGWVAYTIDNIPRTAIIPGTQFSIEIEQGDGTKRTIEHTWSSPILR